MGTPLPSESPARCERTPDYWVGWSLAWFQMRTGHPYRAVLDFVSYGDVRSMYRPLHEADESKLIDVLSARLERATRAEPTRLRALREASGLSQAELARRSGVGLRSIQMYERHNKDVNHAQALALDRLSRVLHCRMEDLLER